MDFKPVLSLVITVFIGGVAALLLPWLHQRLGAERLKTLWKWVCVAVQAAEQIFGSGTGEVKKQYVVDWLHTRQIDADHSLLDGLIEAAVRELT